GNGRATIASNQSGVNANNFGPRNWAILIDCTSGVTVQDINVTNNGHYVQYGIAIQNSCGQWAPGDFTQQQAAGMISNLIVQRVDVGGFTVRTPVVFGEAGAQVAIFGLASAAGTANGCGPINNLQVLDSKFHGNDGPASQVDNGVQIIFACGNLWN